MSRPLPARVSGLLLLLGGVLGAAVPLLHPAKDADYYAHAMTAPSHLLLLAAVLLVSLGLPGLVARQPDAVRPWAAAAAALVFVGEWLLDGTHGIIDGAVLPALSGHAATARLVADPHRLGALLDAGPLGTLTTLGVPVMIAGCVALGVVLWRGSSATPVPRWAALLLALCWVLVPLRFVLPAVAGVDVMLPYVALGCLGVALLAERPPGAAAAGHPVARAASAA
jgi:hypothetical protein